MSLDGITGTPAIAELDGQGRTTLIADGLLWTLVRLPGGALLLPGFTSAGITLVPNTTDKYEVSFTRPSPEGNYAFRWRVPNLDDFDESFQTFDQIPQPLGFVPSVDDVGALIRARTKDQYGNELGTFTANTRPTDTQVELLIAQAYNAVTARVDTDIPSESYGAAKAAIALKAAMLVELSYWPDQVPNNQSPYNQLKEDYEGSDGKGGELAGLVMSVDRESEEAATGEQAEENTPHYNFNDPSRGGVGMGTIW